MVKLNWDDKFNLQMSCQISLPVLAGEKLEMLSAFSCLYQRFEQFANWFDNPDVPAGSKDPFNMHMINAKIGLNYVYKFLQNCGVTDLEIKEFTQIPF
jgi:hypothetical protein